MAICLTNNSVRLLGAYFQKTIPTIYSQEKDFNQLFQELYQSAIKDFKGKLEQVSVEEISDEEVILQHMTVMPRLLSSYMLGEGLGSQRTDLMKRSINEADRVFNSLKPDAAPIDLLNLFNDYAKWSVGQLPTITNTTLKAPANYAMRGITAINFNFASTKAPYSLKDTSIGNKANIEDPRYLVHINTVRNILRAGKSQYQFKLTTKQQMESVEGFMGNLLQQENPPILIIVDSNNNPVRFNEQGIEDVDGFIPAFEINRTASEFGVSTSKSKEGIVTVTKLHKSNVGFSSIAKAKIEYYVETLGMSAQAAQTKVFHEIGVYLTNISKSIEKARKGETVLMSFDFQSSSFGAFEISDRTVTRLTEIKNWESDGFVIEKSNTFSSTQAVVRIPNSTRTAYLQQLPVNSLDPKIIDLLIELFSNNKLLNENKQPLTKQERNALISSYIQLGTEIFVPVEISYGLNTEKDEVVSIKLNGQEFSIPKSTAVKQDIIDLRLKEFREGFLNFINQFHAIDYAHKKVGNYNMVKDLSEVEVHGEVFEPAPNKLMKALQLPISQNLASNPDLDATFPRPVSITAEGVIQTENISFRDHLYETGYLRVMPNRDGQIKSVTPYLAFHNIEQATAINPIKPKGKGRTRFMSVEENNRSTEKLVKGEEEWAAAWVKSLRLEEVGSKLKINLTDKVHKYGPKYLASFFIDSITLYGGSNKTAIYHEVFHAYVDGIMTPKEKMEMFEEIKKAFSGQTLEAIVAGKKKTINIDTLDLTNEDDQLALEEWLAEQFRAYARNESYLKNKDLVKTKSFFQKLLDFLKKLLGIRATYAEATVLATQSAKIHAIFNDLYTGNVDFSKFEPVEMEHEKFASLELDSEIGQFFSEQEVYTAMSSMQVLFHNYIETTINISSEIEINTEVAALYLEMSQLNENTERYEEIDNRLRVIDKLTKNTTRGAGMFVIQNNPELFLTLVKTLYNRLQKQADATPSQDAKELLNKILQFFGGATVEKDTKGNVVKVTPIDIFSDADGKPLSADAFVENIKDRDDSLLALFYNNYTTLNVQEGTFIEEPEQAQKSEQEEYNFDRRGNEYNIADTVDQYTKELLSTLPIYQQRGSGPVEINILGLPKIMPYSMALNRILKAIEGVKNREHMYELLHKAAFLYKNNVLQTEIDEDGDAVPIVMDNTLANLLARLGNPELADTSEEQVQWNRLWLSVGKPTVRLRTAEFVKIENEETGEVRLESRTGKNVLTRSAIKNSWSFDFINKSENLALSETIFDTENIGDVQVRVLNVDKFLSIYDTVENPIWKSDPAAVLRVLGIMIPSTPEVTRMLTSGSTEFDIDPNFISDLISNLRIRQMVAKEKNMEFARNTPVLNRLENLFKEFTYNIVKDNNTYESKSVRGLVGYLNNLADYASTYNDEYITYMSRTPGGESQSEKSFHSSVTVQLAYLNAAEHIDDIIGNVARGIAPVPGLEHFNIDRNPILAANKGFVQMFNLHLPKTDGSYGKRNPKFSLFWENNVGTVIKYKNQESGVKSIKSDEVTKFSTEFMHVLEGRQEILRTEAKTASFSFFVPIQKEGEYGRLRNSLYLNRDEIYNIFENLEYRNLPGKKGLLLYDQFSSYIEAELVRMSRVKKFKEEVLDKLNDDETAEFDSNLLNRGDKFIIFDLMLSADVRDMLKSKNIENSFTLDDVLTIEEKKEIENEIREYFELRSEQLVTIYDEELILADNDIEKFKVNEEESELTTKNRMYNAVVVNSFLQYLSFASLFLGDPSNYDIMGENFHKRIAGVTSTGTPFVADQSWYNYINGENFEMDGFAKNHFDKLSDERKAQLEAQGKPTSYKKRTYRGYLVTAVIKEAKSTSHLLSHYADVIGVSNTKAYKDMEEADGSAWISFDMYRLLAKSSDEWSDGQENLYQAMLRGENIDWRKHKNTFPIRKYQYYGPAFNAILEKYGLSNMEFHKYSLVPLIPDAIENTQLRKLHERMMEEGIDYVAMNSASKLGHMQKIDKNGKVIPNTIYDVQTDTETNTTSRTITEEAFVKNIIHVKHLKSQVHMAEGFKNKITLFSQARKMTYLGIYNGGAPVDFMVNKSNRERKASWEKLKKDFLDGKKSLEDVKKRTIQGEWALRYEQTMSLLQSVLQAELMDELGLVLNTRKVRTAQGKTEIVNEYVADNTKLLNYLKHELKNKDLLPEEIEGIIDPLTNDIMSDLSLSLNSAKIEEILTTLIDKKLRAIKVTGEGFVQQSGTMMERDPQFALDAELQERYNGTNTLNTYAGLDENGNLIVNGTVEDVKQVRFMDVKIAMQEGFEDLFYLEYEDQLIAQYYNKEVPNGKTKREFDYKGSLARLNEAMRDEAWFEEHKEFFTLTGPRIPTQAFNSLEAAYVREFLPQSVGKAIILPSEIVAKAGSDFDIDKLYLMFPNLRRYGKSVEIIRYQANDLTYDEIELKKEKLNTELKEIKTELEQAKTERRKISDTFKDIKDKPELQNKLAAIDKNIETLKESREEEEENLKSINIFASEIRRGIGKAKNYTKTVQKEKLDAISKLRKEYEASIDEHTRVIDELYQQRTQEILKAFGEKFTGVKETDTPKIFKDVAFAPVNKKINDIKKKLEANRSVYYKWARTQDGIGTKGIENQLLSLFAERVTDPKMIKSLVEPNSTSFFDQIAEMIGDKLEADRIYKKYNDGTRNGIRDKRKTLPDGSPNPNYQGLAGTTMFDLQFNIIKHAENSVGLDSLGVAAVTSVFYALLTEFGGYLEGLNVEEQAAYNQAVEVLKRDAAGENIKQAQKNAALQYVNSKVNYTLKFNHNTLEVDEEIEGKKTGKVSNRIALGLAENVEGRNISDVIGQLINGFVDVAKKPWVFNVQGNMENTPQLLFMIMAGIKVDELAKFVNLPLIVEYNQKKARLSGAVSSLNKNLGENPIKSNYQVVKEARSFMFKKYQPVIQEALGKTVSYLEFSSLADLMDNLSELNPETLNTRLDDLFDSEDKASFEQMMALAHYLEIENMASDFTAFTMNTKFDTQKISNISDAQARINNTEDALKNKNSVPNKWYSYFDKNVSGITNNDKFILDTLSRLFALRNHPVLRYKSAQLRRTEETLDKDMSSLRKMYKDQFLNFLYQNSIYQQGYYNSASNPGQGYAFKVDDTLTVSVVIENGIVKYNPYLVQDRINALDAKFGLIEKTVTGELGKEYSESLPSDIYEGEFGEISQSTDTFTITEGIFPTTEHYLRYIIEYQIIEENFIAEKAKFKNQLTEETGKAPTVEELNKKFEDYIYDKYYHVSKSSPTSWAKRTVKDLQAILALYKSGNNVAMFRQGIGYASIFKNITNKHPELADKFELVKNLQPRYDEAFKKNNLALMNNRDAQMIRIYRENLRELQNHTDPVIAEFFQKLDNYAFLQTGMERGSMYDLGRIIADPTKFATIINEGINKNNALINEFKYKVEESYEKGVENVSIAVIQQFEEKFALLINTKEVSRRTKGVNYMVSEIMRTSGGQIIKKVFGSNVSIYNTFTDVPTKSAENPNGMVPLRSADQLYIEETIEDENIKLELLDLKPVASINRSNKKEKFKTRTGEESWKDVEGYRLTVEGHPQLELFTYKNEERGGWFVVEVSKGESFGNKTFNTVKGAIEEAQNLMNKFIRDKHEHALNILFEVGMFADEIAAYKDNTGLKLDLEYIKKLSEENNVGILSDKFIAPEGTSQKELDEVLLQYLGINNTGNTPDLVSKVYGSENNLSIAYANTGLKKSISDQKRKMHHEVIANSATKAIARDVDGGNKTKDYVAAYIEQILQKKNRLAGERAKFNSEDKVWIFGNQNTGQTQGSLSSEQFAFLQETLFDDYYKGYIDKAISAGVETFFVDTFNGVNELARKYLEEKGYYGIPRYSPSGKYFEYVKVDTYQKNEEDYIVIGQPAINLKDFAPELIDENLKQNINDTSVTPLEQLRNGQAENKVKAGLLLSLDKMLKENRPKYTSLVQELVSLKGRHIVVSPNYTDTYSALLEKAIVDIILQYEQAIIQQREVAEKKTFKTASGNVRIYPDDVRYKMENGKRRYDYVAMKAYAKANNGIYSIRDLVWSAEAGAMVGSKYHFGNPFGIKGRDTARKNGVYMVFDTTKETVKAYLDWLTTDKYDGQNTELDYRKRWILEQIYSGNLKGKTIFYYSEKNERTHVNALDYLINGAGLEKITQEEIDKLPQRKGC